MHILCFHNLDGKVEYKGKKRTHNFNTLKVYENGIRRCLCVAKILKSIHTRGSKNAWRIKRKNYESTTKIFLLE